MKKILIMTGSLNVGGIEKALVEMLKIIPYDKYSVDLVLEEPEGVYLEEVPKEVNIIENPTIADCLYKSRKLQIKVLIAKGKTISVARLLFESLIFRLTDNRCRYFDWQCTRMDKISKEYDVAIAYHNPFRFPGHYIIRNVKAKKKILWNHTDLLYDKINYSGFGKLYDGYDSICSVSKAASCSFEKIFPELKDKTTVFYNVINREEISEKAEEFSVENKDNIPVLLTVGRISPEKGQDRIPDIARIIKEKGFDFKWYVVGGGAGLDNIKEKVKEYDLTDNVILTGNKSNPYPYMKNCDIYVQTSWQEGFPMVIGEVLTFNKPCVVTDVGGTTEYFDASETVEMAKQNDDESIAESIMKLLVDKDYYNRIKNNVSTMQAIDYSNRFIELIEGEL